MEKRGQAMNNIKMFMHAVGKHVIVAGGVAMNGIVGVMNIIVIM
jgi:hypothetical protein